MFAVFLFFTILLIILCTPSSPPPTKHEKHNLWLRFSCWRPLLPIWAPKTHPMGVFWVLSMSPPIRAAKDKKRAHMGMFLVFGGTPAAIFPTFTNQTWDSHHSFNNTRVTPCLTTNIDVTTMAWQECQDDSRGDDNGHQGIGLTMGQRMQEDQVRRYFFIIYCLFSTFYLTSQCTYPTPTCLSSLFHQPKHKNCKSVHSFHVWIYRHTIPPPPSIFSCSPCSQHEKHGLYYTTFFVFRTCSCFPLLPKTNSVSGEARFSTSLHLFWLVPTCWTQQMWHLIAFFGFGSFFSPSYIDICVYI